MATPGGAIHPFWEPVTSTSMPRASVSRGRQPAPLTLATQRSLPRPLITAAGAAARIEQHVMLGAQRPAQAAHHVVEKRGELRAAMIDHRPAGGADDTLGQRGGTGNAKLCFCHVSCAFRSGCDRPSLPTPLF